MGGAGGYRFGYRFKETAPDTDGVQCRVEALPDSGCPTADTAIASISVNSGAASLSWASQGGGVYIFNAPANTGSLRVTCQSNSTSDVWIDQIFLNPVGNY